MKIKVDGEMRTTAIVDISNSVSLLILPYNKGRYHWVFFIVHPLTLQQSFYDSFPRQISGIHNANMFHSVHMDGFKYH